MNRIEMAPTRWLLVLITCAFTGVACGSSSGSGSSNSNADASDAVVGDATAQDVVIDDTGSADSSGDSDSVAVATDTGNDAAGPVCKSPEKGVCVGTTLTYCEVGVGDQSYDCDDGEGASCAKISDDYGFDCVLPKDVTCTFINDDGDVDWAFCAGAGAGCVFSTKNLEGGCQVGLDTCKDEEIGECKGTSILVDCFGSQPLSYDCKDFGGTCTAGNEHATCTGIAKGGVCDDVFLICAGGNDCTIADDADYGVCP